MMFLHVLVVVAGGNVHGERFTGAKSMTKSKMHCVMRFINVLLTYLLTPDKVLEV